MSAEYDDFLRRWWWTDGCKSPTPTQRAVLLYLDRTGEGLEETDGRFRYTGPWRSPEVYPDGNPKLTVATAQALVRAGWIAPEEPAGGEIAAAAPEAGSVVTVDFRRAREPTLTLFARRLYEWSQMAATGDVAGEPTGLVVGFLGREGANWTLVGDATRGQIHRFADDLVRAAHGYGRAAPVHRITPHGRYAILVGRQRDDERGLEFLALGEVQRAHREERRALLAGMGHPKVGDVW